MSGLLPLEGGYTPPGTGDFEFDPFFGGEWLYFNKPMAQLVIAFVLTLGFWLIASRNLKVVPSKFQLMAEALYEYVRNGIGRDMLGQGFRPYIGLLVGIFTFVLINNWFGEFFIFMLPTFSNVGYTWGMVIFVWLLYVGLGFKTHGIGYLKHALIPSGVPKALYPVIVPVEFISNFLTRPLTLGVRLFANMFAGHLALLVFIVGGSYLLFEYQGSMIYRGTGAISLLFSFAMIGLELFLGFLQAFIFTILTAQYISSSISEEH